LNDTELPATAFEGERVTFEMVGMLPFVKMPSPPPPPPQAARKSNVNNSDRVL